MTEEEAQDWIRARFGDAGVSASAALAALVIEESGRQNLIAPSTLEAIWVRHIVDSAQLIALAEAVPGPWLDIGTGAGFPGLVVAALTQRETLLVEPRHKRAEFLKKAADALAIADRIIVHASRVEAVSAKCSVISARAVAYLGDIFASALQCSTENTLWILPKGQSAREEVAQARQTWQGSFHVEHSVTDPNSLIVLASGISRR